MLSQIVLEEQKIDFRGGTFTVRGIGLDSIAYLMNTGNRDELESAVASLEAIFEAKGDAGALQAGLMSLVTQLPALCAKVVALAAGEPDEWEKVLKLPLPVQLEAVNAIGRLTFDGEDSIRSFMAGLLILMSGLTTTMKVAGQTLGGTRG